MAFDPIFRWLEDMIISKNPAALDFFQPVPCAYADDFAVAASSFLRLMTALTPAFKVVDQIAGLNLSHRKCCWVQYGRESGQSLLNGVATNCEEFREMKIVRYAKYVGTMIGPEGHIHRWTAPRKKFIHRAQKINASTKNLVQRFCELNIYALSVFGSIGSISAPDEATLKDEAHALQCTTAGPYNAIPTSLLRVGSVCGLGHDLLVIHTLSLAARKRTAADSSALANGLAKIQAAREN